MLEGIIKQMIESRLIVMMAILSICALGIWNFQNLPIDAVPDITNVQVQINTETPGYSPQTSSGRCCCWSILVATNNLERNIEDNGVFFIEIFYLFLLVSGAK